MRMTWSGWLSVLSGAVFWWSCAAGQALRPPTPVIVTSPPPVRENLSFSEQVLRALFPYRQGPPQAAGLAPGVAVSRGNWNIAQDVLPVELLHAVRDGELTVLLQETSDLPVSPEYITATLEHAPTVSLDETGAPVAYKAGLPFPAIEVIDPQAGLKAAWNARYADSGDSLQRWESLQMKNSAGEYQYGFSFFYARAYGMHRARPERAVAGWEAQGILYKEFMQVLHPAPATTVHPQLGLVHLWYWYDKDTHPVGQWYITGGLTINKLLTLVYNPESSAWRFPMLYEDFVGSYIYTHHWRLLESKVALVPGFVQGPDPLFGGQRAGYPLDPWELRTVYVVEAVPRRVKHPYGRKVFFFDQQTFAPCYVLIYDRDGKHWRTVFFVYAHPTHYPGARDMRVPILIGRSWIDLTIDRAALALVKEAVYNQPFSPEFFTQANMIRKGK